MLKISLRNLDPSNAMYPFCFTVSGVRAVIILAALVVCLSAVGISLHAQASGCGCSANKPAIEQQAKHECTCHRMHKTPIQRIVEFFKGTYVRGGLEMRQYTQVARSRGDVGFMWGVGYGFQSEPMRLELILQHNTTTFKANTPALKAKARTFFINGYYDFVYETLQSKHLTPYITAGAGQTKYYDGSVTFISYSSKNDPQTQIKTNIEKTKIAWNAGVGLKFELHKNAAVDLGYRYLVLGKFSQTSYVKGHQVLMSAILTL